MIPAKELPKVTEKSQEDIEHITELVRSSNLPEEVIAFIIGCINLACWIPKALVEHKITVSNLKRLIFGKGDKKPLDTTSTESIKPESSQRLDNNQFDTSPEESPTPKGHGRLPHTVYTDAKEHQIQLERLTVGQLCPLECGGKLYQLEPGIIVNIKGQNLASVDKYWLEKLRCALCNEIFTADLPSYVNKDKYQLSFKAMLALQKYHMAMPFHRQEHFQSLIGFPLPTSTQWQLIEELTSSALLIFPTLENLAANGHLIHNDDTVLRIVDIIRYNRKNPGQKRTGMFTTGILAQNGTHKIALFYNSKRHSGENMERLLDKRDKNKKQVIQMCDALAHNIPDNHETIVCYCLSHAFRKFEELEPFYPAICQTIMKLLSVPFKVDKLVLELNYDTHQRLLYHQKHSQTAMVNARQYMEELLLTKQIEPNESLGKAINYMLKRWGKFTQFLKIPGAPIHNNDMERGLKIPIRGRNTWLFYKTEYGAMVGGILTSIIYTCELAGTNPFDYLVALQVYKDQIVKEPSSWLPWNYDKSRVSLISSKAA